VDLARLGEPFPNPTTGAVSFTIDLPVGGPVTVSVFDVTGRRIASVLDGDVGPGRHALRWDPAGTSLRLSGGLYVLRVAAGGRVESRRIVITR
jgi:hypothetical protein